MLVGRTQRRERPTFKRCNHERPCEGALVAPARRVGAFARVQEGAVKARSS